MQDVDASCSFPQPQLPHLSEDPPELWSDAAWRRFCQGGLAGTRGTTLGRFSDDTGMIFHAWERMKWGLWYQKKARNPIILHVFDEL